MEDYPEHFNMDTLRIGSLGYRNAWHSGAIETYAGDGTTTFENVDVPKINVTTIQDIQEK
jgi:hypothetical protein